MRDAPLSPEFVAQWPSIQTDPPHKWKELTDTRIQCVQCLLITRHPALRVSDTLPTCTVTPTVVELLRVGEEVAPGDVIGEGCEVTLQDGRKKRLWSHPIACIRKKRRDAEDPTRDGAFYIESLRGWLRSLHADMLRLDLQSMTQDEIAVALDEYPRNHPRKFMVTDE